MNFSPTEEVLVFGVLLGVYVVALTISARAESKGTLNAGTRVGLMFLLFLPVVVHLIFLLIGFNKVYQSLVIPAFVAPVACALHKLRQGGPAIGQAVGWMLAAIPAVDALAVAHWSLPLAWTFVAIVPLLRLWQRVIAAT